MCPPINMICAIECQLSHDVNIIEDKVRTQHHKKHIPDGSVISTLSCLATSLAEDPETSIHVLENRAQAESMKTV